MKLTPQSPDDKAEGATVGRFSLDKSFKGDLEGTSKGEMLAVSTPVQGSAGCVAMEQVTGTLSGRTGRSNTMTENKNREAPDTAQTNEDEI